MGCVTFNMNQCVFMCVWLLGGCRALQAPRCCQSPVFSSSGSEGTLPVLTAHLQLEHFLISFLVLIG